MGDLSISMNLPGRNRDRHIRAEFRDCENRNCTRGPGGTREEVLSIEIDGEGGKKFCCDRCRVYWNNKGRK